MYRRRHVLQQYEERKKLKENIESTKELDELGRVKVGLAFSDGMTATKGACTCTLLYYTYKFTTVLLLCH
jgi:hypothetical protein